MPPLIRGFAKRLPGIATKAAEASKAFVSVFLGILAAGRTGAPPSAANFDPAVLRGLVAAMRDLATEARLDETIEGLRVAVGDVGGSLGVMRIGFGAKSPPDGMLNARLDIGLEDPKVASPPLGPFETFVPRRFSIRPTLSGVRTADLFAIASTSETQSMVLLQAMSSGLPAVGARWRALPEYIGDDAGLLAEPGDAAQFAAHLLSILRAPSMRAQMGERATAAARRFGLAETVSAWEQIYAAQGASHEIPQRNAEGVFE